MLIFSHQLHTEMLSIKVQYIIYIMPILKIIYMLFILLQYINFTFCVGLELAENRVTVMVMVRVRFHVNKTLSVPDRVESGYHCQCCSHKVYFPCL